VTGAVGVRDYKCRVGVSGKWRPCEPHRSNDSVTDAAFEACGGESVAGRVLVLQPLRVHTPVGTCR
jgi:hypothetical protein